MARLRKRVLRAGGFKKTYKKKAFKKKSFKKKHHKKRYRKKHGRRRHKKNIKHSITASDYRYNEGGVCQSYQNTGGVAPVVTVGQDIFVGHGTVGNKLMDTFWTAVLKKLMAKYGIFYSNEQEVALRQINDTQTFQIRVIWRRAEDYFDINTSLISIGAQDTVRQVGLNISSTVQTDYRAIIGPTNFNYPRLKNIELRRTYTNTTVLNETMCELPLDRAIVKISYSSVLKLQNKTQTEGGSISTDVLGINPLQARLYKGHGYKNYIGMKLNLAQDINSTNTTPPLTTRNWVPSGDASGIQRNGLIYDADVRHTLNCFQMLPTKKEVDCHSTKDFILHPAQIVKDSAAFSTRIGIDKFFDRMRTTFTTNAFETMELGVAHVIGLDKLLFDRSVSGNMNSATPVVVGYEIDSRYIVDVTFKKLRSAPYVEINNLFQGQSNIE